MPIAVSSRLRRHAFAALVCCLSVTTARAQGAKSTTSKPAANQPAEGATSGRMMSLIRDGKPRAARAQGASYLALHPGTPRTREHCHILIAFAWADVLLDRREEAGEALGVYDRGCKHTAIRNEYFAEVGRIRRVLRGEPVGTVYPK